MTGRWCVRVRVRGVRGLRAYAMVRWVPVARDGVRVRCVCVARATMVRLVRCECGAMTMR